MLKYLLSVHNYVLFGFSEKFSSVPEDEFAHVVKAIITAYKHGVFVSKNESSKSNWDIESSIFFSATVLSTIGKI